MDRYLLLGDYVGYNASPAAVLDLVMDLSPAEYISGNHDRYLIGTSDPAETSEENQKVIEWTRDQITEDQLQFLQDCKVNQVLNDRYMMAHGSPRDEDEYILSVDRMRQNILYLQSEHPEIQICFVGHTHAPLVSARGVLERTFHEDRRISLDPEKTYLINPGSVGQPRDGCPKASFGLFDTEKMSIKIFRRAYDVEAEQQIIYDAPVSDEHAERLQTGK